MVNWTVAIAAFGAGAGLVIAYLCMMASSFWHTLFHRHHHGHLLGKRVICRRCYAKVVN